MNYSDESQDQLIFSKTEEKLIYTLILNIINKLQEFYSFKGFFNEFYEFLKPRINLKTNFWEQLIKLSEQIDNNQNFESLNFSEEDILGSTVQKNLDAQTRKKIAANYTTRNSAELLIKNLPEREYKKIIDPFCGSGRLISAYLNHLPLNKEYPEIYISDNHFLAVALAYYNILNKFIQKKENLSKINADFGDSFSLYKDDKGKTKYDLILINPPFTRIHRFDNKQVNSLKWLNIRFSKLLKGQPGLHIYSLLLSRSILNPHGVIAAVLPLATFTSDYSKEVQQYILNEFESIKFINSKNTIAFSEGSNIREILTILDSNNSSQFIEFIKFSFNKGHWDKINHKQYLKNDIQKEFNLSLLFNSDNAIDLMKQLLSSKKIQSAKSLKLDIIRGLEMYGPDYFFLPNKTWKIKEIKQNQIIISHGSQILHIKKSSLRLALRRPGLYLEKITPNINEYAIDINENNHNEYPWLETYNLLTEKYAKTAKNKFGKLWMNHIHNQIKNKDPFSHIFFIDKFSILSTSVMCHFTDEEITSSKNFYLIRELNLKESKLLAAWINSTIYLLLFLLQRREIGGSYGRMQISDLKKHKMFYDIFTERSNEVDTIIELFDEYRKLPLDPIPKQVNNVIKQKIDLMFLDLLGIKDKDHFLSEIHNEVGDILSDLELRDFPLR